MDIITSKREMGRALGAMDVFLKSTYGLPQKWKWSFPDGSIGLFPTWIPDNKGVVVGFSTKRLMNSGRPIVLTPNKSASVFTPVVEINIPAQANVRVQGCFAFDERNRLWLCHRGARLTVQAYHRKRLSKKLIHTYFRNWLVLACERNSAVLERKTRIIRITVLPGKDVRQNLQRFMDSVAKLKKAWIECRGDDEEMRNFVSKYPA